jgi:hypothetical protein
VVNAQARITAIGIAEIIPESIYFFIGVQLADGISPALRHQLAESLPRFGAEERIIYPPLRFVYIQLGRHHIKVSRQYHRHIMRQQFGGMQCKPFKPFQLVVKLRPRSGVAVWQVQAAYYHIIYYCLYIPAVQVLGVAGQRPPYLFYFLAQDVEKVYPEAIAIDNEGFYAMNYNAIIPLLSNAIKEQQATIEEVKKANEELKHALAEMCKKGCGGVDFTRIQNNTLFSGAYLLQNVPNPAAGQTKLGYFIPDNLGASSAKIIVTDLTGKTISTLEATPTGSGTVQFNTATLTAGIYSYSLIVDGNVADTKKMIVE